ncbi:MAG: hypothetical protein ACI8P9_002579 [Parasphingorhabdus sp.]|jgi:hypothetical protein
MTLLHKFLCCIAIVLLLLGSTLNLSMATDNPLEVKEPPAAGYIPDEKTAIAVAVAVWNAIYGDEEIALQEPYQATQENGAWLVNGTLSPGLRGGTAYAVIDKASGKIISVHHSR